MKLGTWITDNFAGIREGIEKGSLTCLLARERDKKIGREGARVYKRSAFPVDMKSHACGPRRNTWWKRVHQVKRTVVSEVTSPPIYTK